MFIIYLRPTSFAIAILSFSCAYTELGYSNVRLVRVHVFLFIFRYIISVSVCVVWLCHDNYTILIMLYGKYIYSIILDLAKKRRILTPILILCMCAFLLCYYSQIFFGFYINFPLSYSQHIIGIVLSGMSVHVGCVCRVCMYVSV